MRPTRVASAVSPPDATPAYAEEADRMNHSRR